METKHLIRLEYNTKKEANDAKKQIKQYIKDHGSISYTQLYMVHTINNDINKVKWDNMNDSKIEKNENNRYFLCMPIKIIKTKENKREKRIKN